jgi:AraC family transcriptional regulator of adaptative response/methylated-DNA-[protein]-cysteine methyltransferase
MADAKSGSRSGSKSKSKSESKSERIRFAWGPSSLGEILVASSDKGVVAFEFANDRTDIIVALRKRFPEAVVEADDIGLCSTVLELAHLVDHPDQEPDIALDPRGSDYEKQVWTMLREIPPGETTTYGALAATLGTRDAREVTEAVGANAVAILIPCHRVLKRDGSISGYRWGVHRKRALLGRERQSTSTKEHQRRAHPSTRRV